MSSGEAARRMEEKIDAVLRKNAATAHALLPRTPLEELLRDEPGWDQEELEIRREERLATFRLMLAYFFQGGPHPLLVLRAVFALTKAVRPELIGDMSLEDIAVICGDKGKATVSARIERLYNRTLEKAGVEAARAPFQKRSAKYAASQMGNRNRKRKGKRPKA